MGRIILSMSHSLDGYITDAEGRFGGGTPFYPRGVGPTSLELVSSHRWARGIQALRYRVVRPAR